MDAFEALLTLTSWFCEFVKILFVLWKNMMWRCEGEGAQGPGSWTKSSLRHKTTTWCAYDLWIYGDDQFFPKSMKHGRRINDADVNFSFFSTNILMKLKLALISQRSLSLDCKEFYEIIFLSKMSGYPAALLSWCQIMLRMPSPMPP